MPLYTFTKKAIPALPNQQSNFGSVQRDGSKQPLTGVLGNGFQTSDGTGTLSPVSLSATVPQVLNNPTNASSLTITAKTADVYVSEVANVVSYTTIPAGSSDTFEIANQGTVYLLGASGASASFYYQIV